MIRGASSIVPPHPTQPRNPARPLCCHCIEKHGKSQSFRCNTSGYEISGFGLFCTSALLHFCNPGRFAFPAIQVGRASGLPGEEVPAIRGGELPAHSLFKKTLLRNCTAHSAGFVFRAVHFSSLPHFSEVFYHTICDLMAMDYDTINSSQKITDINASLLQTSPLSVPPGNRFLFSGRYKLQKQSFDTGSNCREGKSAKTKGKKSSQEARNQSQEARNQRQNHRGTLKSPPPVRQKRPQGGHF